MRSSGIERYSPSLSHRFKYTDWFWGYALIAPTIIGLGVLNIWPIVRTFQYSFMEDLGFNRFAWVGTAHYIRLARSHHVWNGLRNTILFALISVPLGVFVALIAGALLSGEIRGKGVYRTIFFLPVVVVPAAMAIVWRVIFNSRYGVFNWLLSRIGLPGQGWIIDPNVTMVTLISVAIWSGLGTRIVVILAGITQIPPSLYESAKIDGAGPIRTFFSITVPLVIPSIFFLTITGFITALREFDTVYLVFMSNNISNPGLDGVRTLMYEFYRWGFGEGSGGNKGYASTIVVIAFGVILSFTIGQNLLQKRLSSYD